MESPSSANQESDRIRLWSSLSDFRRLRILSLLRHQELSVAELEQSLRLSQPAISHHLSVLKNLGLVVGRKEGQRTFYRLERTLPPSTLRIVEAAWSLLEGTPQLAQDQKSLSLVLAKRRLQAQKHFNKVAGRLSEAGCPGRGWAAVGPLLAQLVPEAVVADLGAGEGWLAQLLAQRARKVIAVDLSPKMVAFARRELQRKGIQNVEYRLGDLTDPPIEPETVDIAILSQSLHHAPDPPKAILAATQILRPGGRLLVLDLRRHHFEAARTLYGDLWLGFHEMDLVAWFDSAGLQNVGVQLLEPEDRPPRFQPLLVFGFKPQSCSPGQA
ncbi:ArsR/SmtB family transcription factor [Candidatus Methylacidithermus pantelleriae]|nr:metalloregulator ArsR/SmtB family transcription factor [Candidatus Methylacidithermus pantelleriae]